MAAGHWCAIEVGQRKQRIELITLSATSCHMLLGTSSSRSAVADLIWPSPPPACAALRSARTAAGQFRRPAHVRCSEVTRPRSDITEPKRLMAAELVITVWSRWTAWRPFSQLPEVVASNCSSAIVQPCGQLPAAAAVCLAAQIARPHQCLAAWLTPSEIRSRSLLARGPSACHLPA